MRAVLTMLGIVAISTACLVGARAEDKKVTIKDVMKNCMKGGLCKKVASGGASDAEKKQLLAAFEALAAAKPPRGDAESWKAKSSALVAAAKKAVAGDDGAGEALKAAANCKSCHSAHKPPK